MVNTNKNEPKKIKVNPLSLAKYFYDNQIEDIAIIQRLIYLTYLEVLEKENILLDFEEDWQAWPHSPVLESVFFGMMECWKNYGSYEKLFSKFPSLNDEIIIRYCQKWIIYYHKEIKKNKQHYKLWKLSQNEPWIIARNKVSNYIEDKKIEVNDIINFVQQEKNSVSEKRRLRV